MTLLPQSPAIAPFSAIFVMLVVNAVSAPPAFAESRSAIPVTVESGSRVKTGTAVLVKTRSKQLWLLTAYHVVRGNGMLSLQLEAGIDKPAKTAIGAHMQTCVLPRYDLFAIRVWGSLHPLTATTMSTSKSYGGAVLAVGNAEQELAVKTRVRNYEELGAVGSIMTAASIGSIATGEGANTPLLVLSDLGITYGFSGGPVFDASKLDSKLRGMVLGGKPGGRTWALPGHVIANALAESCTADLYTYDGTRLFKDGKPQDWPPELFKSELYSSVPQSQPARDVQLNLGVDLVSVGQRSLTTHAVVNVGPQWRWRRSRIVLGFGGGLAAAFVERRTYAPLGNEVLSSKAENPLWGGRAQTQIQFQFPTGRRLLEIWLGPGAFLERYFFASEGQEEGAKTKRMRYAAAFELTFAVLLQEHSRRLLFQPRIGYQRMPALDYDYLHRPPDRTARAPQAGLFYGFSLGCSFQRGQE